MDNATDVSWSLKGLDGLKTSLESLMQAIEGVQDLRNRLALAETYGDVLLDLRWNIVSDSEDLVEMSLPVALLPVVEQRTLIEFLVKALERYAAARVKHIRMVLDTLFPVVPGDA